MADNLQGEFIKKMKKLIFGLIATVLMTSFSFGQSSKLGNFSSAEIGSFHNQTLTLLKKNNLVKGTPQQLKELLSVELPKIDARLDKLNVNNSIDYLYANSLFLTNIKKNQDVPSFQVQVLTFLVDKKEISSSIKDLLIKNSGSTLEILKSEVNKALSSSAYTNNYKDYLKVYVSVYENSYNYWNQAPNSRQCQWCIYAGDAVGGILGLYGGPVWSIIQGAAVSAALDNP